MKAEERSGKPGHNRTNSGGKPKKTGLKKKATMKPTN